jgi:hypothetical protein
MGTKNNPGEFDCHAKAEPDEPTFTLLARDLAAPHLVRQWATARGIELLKQHGGKADLGKDEARQIREAFACADAMTEWRTKNRPLTGDGKKEEP